MDILSIFKEEGFPLDEEGEKKFKIYLEELIRWNKVHNLVSYKSEEELVRRHFINSLEGLRVLKSLGEFLNKSFADVGAGAGFPSLPLKIYLKDIRLTLIESNQKRCSFLEYLKVKMGEDYKVLCSRVEEVKEKFDFVLCRALGKLEEIDPKLMKICKGYIIIWKGEGAKEKMGYKVLYDKFLVKRVV